jgi:hypothetical protein
MKQKSVKKVSLTEVEEEFKSYLVNLKSVLKKDKKEFFLKIKEYILGLNTDKYRFGFNSYILESLFSEISKICAENDYMFRSFTKKDLDSYIKKYKKEVFAEFLKISHLLSIVIFKTDFSEWKRDFDVCLLKHYKFNEQFIEIFGEKINIENYEEYMLPETLYIPFELTKQKSIFSKSSLNLFNLENHNKLNHLYIGLIGTFSDLNLLKILEQPDLIHEVFSNTEKTQTLLDNLTLNLSFHSFNYNEILRLRKDHSNRMDSIEKNIDSIKSAMLKNQEKLDGMLKHLSNKIIEVHEECQSIRSEINNKIADDIFSFDPIKGRTSPGTKLADRLRSEHSQASIAFRNKGLYKLDNMDKIIEWIIPKIEKFDKKTDISEIKVFIDNLLKRKAFVYFNKELYLLNDTEILFNI